MVRRLAHLIWGAEVDRALRPVLVVTLMGSLAGSSAWSLMGIWAVQELGATSAQLSYGYLMMAVVGGLVGYTAGLSGSSSQAMVADLVPPERHEEAYASVRVAANLGVTMGPPIGSLFLIVGGWEMFFPGVSLLAVSAWVLAASVFAYVVYIAYETVLPISLVESHGIPSWGWGLLLVVNPLLVTVFQLRLTRRVSGVPAARKWVAAMLLMGLPFLALGGVRGHCRDGVRVRTVHGAQVRGAAGDTAMWAAIAVVAVAGAALGAIACRGLGGRHTGGASSAVLDP